MSVKTELDTSGERGHHGLVTPAEIVGANLRRAREAAELSQREFGERLGSLLGTAWPRQAVSAAEKGERRFEAAELMAFSAVLARTPAWFLTPREPWAEVAFPSGKTVPWEKVSQSSDAEGPSSQELGGAFFMVTESVKKAESDLAAALTGLESVRLLAEYFDALGRVRTTTDEEEFERGMRTIAGALDQLGESEAVVESIQTMIEVRKRIRESREEKAEDGND